jgi:hypothetical protein
MGTPAPIKTQPPKPRAKSPGKSLADFRASHDKNFIVPHKIRQALKKIGAGWEYELDLLKIAGLSTGDLAHFRDQFEDHIVNTTGKNPKRVWCGTVKLAAQLRDMV